MDWAIALWNGTGLSPIRSETIFSHPKEVMTNILTTIRNHLHHDACATCTFSIDCDHVRITSESRNVSLDPFNPCTLVQQSGVCIAIRLHLFSGEESKDV